MIVAPRGLLLVIAICGTLRSAPLRAETDVETIELVATPAIVIKVEAKPQELEGALARAYLLVFAEAQNLGVVLDGAPFARYLSSGSSTSLVVVEAGFAIRGKPPKKVGKKLRVITLPAGPAVAFTHRGRRETLPAAHAELERWIASERRRAMGARWEIYETNPISTPDPAAQRTRIVVPLAPPAH